MFWLALYDEYIYGLDLEGNIKYIIQFSTNNYEVLSSVIQHNDKLYLGSFEETAIGVIQLPDSIVSINEPQLELPKNFFLSQNYPNPFNPSTTIEFTLPKSEFVELKVYNILGKQVLNLVSKKLNQGSHTYTFDGSKLASGVYYYQLVAGEYTEVMKMILLR